MLEKQSANFNSLDYDVPQPRSMCIKIKQKLYAKAIYDNSADSSNELNFKKGDILTVLEQDTDGLRGWWLCTLAEQTGICPGNRLRILNSYDSGCYSTSPHSSPSASLAASTATLNSSIFSAADAACENAERELRNSGNPGGMSADCPDGGSGVYLNFNQMQWHSNNNNNNTNNSDTLGSRRSWHAAAHKIAARHSDVQHAQRAATPTPFVAYGGVQLRQPRLHAIYKQQQQQQLLQQQQEQIYSNQSIYQNLPLMASPHMNGGAATNGSTNGGIAAHEFETYDVPKPATPINYDSPKNVLSRTPPAHAFLGGGSGNSTPTQLAQRFDSLSLSLKGCAATIEEESYDVPRPLHSSNSLLHHQSTLTPSSSNSSLLTSESLSLSFSSSNRSSLANMPDYDIPRRNPVPVLVARSLTPQQQLKQQQMLQLQQQQQQLHGLNGNGMTQSMSAVAASATTPTKELPLELSSALEALAKLQSEATAATTRLLSFVSPSWRQRDKLEPVIMEVQLATVRLRSALHDLLDFGDGSLGNATRSEDRSLPQKLRPLVRALRDAHKLISESSDVLDAQAWSLDRLARNDDKSAMRPPDSLDQLIACALTLTEDVRQIASFIQGNAPLLFRRQLMSGSLKGPVNGSTASLAAANASNDGVDGNSDWLDNYDYVSFESKDAAAQKHSALREAISPSLMNKFDTEIKAAEATALDAASGVMPSLAGGSGGGGGESPAATTPTATTAAGAATPLTPTANAPACELSEKDKQLVRYYAVQITTHMGNLRQAINSFFETVQKNQPPRYFIAYGKFVVVSAHNLVSIGDILHRNLAKEDLRSKILKCTDALSDALKNCVAKSKRAVTHFPSVQAVQEMVDSVTDISRLATELKEAMLRASLLAT